MRNTYPSDLRRSPYIERGDKDGDWRWGDKAKGFLIAE